MAWPDEWLQLHLATSEFGAAADAQIDVQHPPTSDELTEMMTRGSRIPLDVVKAHPHGATFVDPAEFVQAKDPGWTDRLDVGEPPRDR